MISQWTLFHFAEQSCNTKNNFASQAAFASMTVLLRAVCYSPLLDIIITVKIWDPDKHCD